MYAVDDYYHGLKIVALSCHLNLHKKSFFFKNFRELALTSIAQFLTIAIELQLTVGKHWRTLSQKKLKISPVSWNIIHDSSMIHEHHAIFMVCFSAWNAMIDV